ncbi:uncharacterized protein EV154DRAFT_419343 [Mucor mucedo]|uniref:uncharacterized protein n=1 Tax=Mucor mucedo TaxID=29922 RepID=UPI0022202F12|nr:uncharacterized protein EV154DRAFT_419343 [Mucor mucedo]KAI7892018.1 hypothetical protein EV154DRAFT_419343 [Mucor mucedo]
MKKPEEADTLMQCPTSMVLLFILSLEAVLVSIIEGFIIYFHSMVFAQCKFTLDTLGFGQADLIYHGIFIMAPIYQLFLYLDALRQRNIIQLFALIIFSFLMVCFSAIQTVQHMTYEQAGCNLDYRNATQVNSTDIASSAYDFQDDIDAGVSNIRPFEYAVASVIGICFIIMLACSFKLYKLFHWNNYLSHTFTDLRLRNALIAWSVVTGLLKIDFFFIFAYAIQLVPAAVIGYTDILAFECIIVYGISLVGFLLGIHSIRNENMKALTALSTIITFSIGYFVYRLYTFIIPRETTADPFWLTRYELIFTAMTMTLLSITTLGACLICIRNVCLKKVRILESFQCVCTTCYMHTATMESASSIKKQSLDLEPMVTAQSFRGQIY